MKKAVPQKEKKLNIKKRNARMDYLSNDRITEVLIFHQAHGEKAAKDVFNISAETIHRYKREAKKRKLVLPVEQSAVISKILKNYTPKELRAIAEGGRIMPGTGKIPIVDFTGERIRIGAISDPHFGSSFTNPDYMYQAYEVFKKEKVEFIVISGDVTDGLSNRPDHIYLLTHIGYAAQKEHTKKILEQAPVDVYAIDGNHDRWYLKSSGALIVEDICGELKKAHYLGQDEGDISLKGKAKLKLWHGEDGNSYAISYRIQKVIESFTGGEKPQVMFLGHCHKMAYLFVRNIHAFSLGSIQQQSKWMRAKRIAVHCGFWIIDIWVNKKGVSSCRGRWYPFYA